VYTVVLVVLFFGRYLFAALFVKLLSRFLIVILATEILKVMKDDKDAGLRSMSMLQRFFSLLRYILSTCFLFLLFDLVSV
jgi:hypothetical protein